MPRKELQLPERVRMRAVSLGESGRDWLDGLHDQVESLQVFKPFFQSPLQQIP